jgi:hypothetical protein
VKQNRPPVTKRGKIISEFPVIRYETKREMPREDRKVAAILELR